MYMALPKKGPDACCHTKNTCYTTIGWLYLRRGRMQPLMYMVGGAAPSICYYTRYCMVNTGWVGAANDKLNAINAPFHVDRVGGRGIDHGGLNAQADIHRMHTGPLVLQHGPTQKTKQNVATRGHYSVGHPTKSTISHSTPKVPHPVIPLYFC